MQRSILRQRSIRPVLATAAIFLILGIGNVAFGRAKLNHYEPLLKSAQNELQASHKTHPHQARTVPTINIDHQTTYINRLNWAISYYNLVTLGGRTFLAIAGILLLWILVAVKLGQEEALPDRTDMQEKPKEPQT